MTERLGDLTDFFLHLDDLKAVERRTYIRGGDRRGNSAEHSWHLAMACWSFAKMFEDESDVDRLIKMHGFVEQENPEV